MTRNRTSRWWTVPIAGALLLVGIGTAKAQTAEVPPTQVGAPSKAWEIEVGSGYNVGFGRLAENRDLRQEQGGGASLELGFGYRLNPNLMFGVYGTGATYDMRGNTLDPNGVVTANNGNVYGTTGGVQAQWHMLPYDRLDPFIGLGVGWRGQFIVPNAGPTVARHGLDFARLRAGVDIKFSPDFAIAPVLGANFSVLLTEDVPGAGFTNIADPRVNVFMFGGVMGRFDVGGTRSVPAERVAAYR